jgi:hypothetical protein
MEKVDLMKEQLSFHFLCDQSILSKKRLTIAKLSAIMIVACFLLSLPFALANDANSIETANSSINSAFINVLAAEKAGGNITGLLKRLNDAADLLAEAENSRVTGDPNDVSSKAETSRQIADKVNDDAIKLLANQLAESNTNFWLTIAFSSVGVTAFVLILWVVWKRSKRRFMNKLLDMKPEVLKDASG